MEFRCVLCSLALDFHELLKQGSATYGVKAAYIVLLVKKIYIKINL